MSKKGDLEWLFKILLWIAVFALFLAGLYLMYRRLS
jgi:hypothetical protein